MPTATSTVRADGRPEVYACPPGVVREYTCLICDHTKVLDVKYTGSESFMTHPEDSEDGEPHILCHHHLPDNVVIYDPRTNKCSNKSGTNTWKESKGDKA
jgi:hypothetical protein